MPTMQQAGAIPYRWTKSGIEYLIITSLKGRWIFPKGVVDPGETPPETAFKESWEEAGIVGEVEEPPVGSYGSAKWGYELEIVLYLLAYKKDAEEWEEEGMRTRRWCPYEEARAALSRGELRELLDRAHERLTQG